jgi:cell division protease FtsH
MSEKLGPRVFGHDHGQPFLGREFSSEPDYSDDIAREIDGEIRRIVEEAHQTARAILERYRRELDQTSDVLLRRETIERDEFIQLLDGKSEADVFGPDEPVVPQPAPDEPKELPEAKREGPRPLPRPGFAAEMRGDDGPKGPTAG